jgi:geranylgeranylglycerol-phosphate geranylgeranyltransferase
MTAGTIALNDYYDLAIDRINKPDRPLPSNRIAPATAKEIGLICYSAGLLQSFAHGSSAVIFASVLMGLAHIYNRMLKKTILANFMVGFLCVCGLIYGLGNTSISWRLFFPCLIVFSFISSREILKTVEDYQGDLRAEVVNFATRFGVQATLQIYRVASAMVILLTLIPFALDQGNAVYLLAMFFGVDLPILAGHWWLSGEYEPANVRVTLRLTKMSFFLGLPGLALL